MSELDMNDLRTKALSGLVGFLVVFAVLLFLPAWSLRYWEAWVYWVVFSAGVLAVTLYLLRHDPDLVARRMAVGPGAEREKGQQVIQALASLFVCALVAIPGVERRFQASRIPVSIVLLADTFVVAGFGIGFLAFRANSHASSVIEVTPGQPVISTGPYGVVRHPMYSAAVVLFLATPLSLGSLWALIPGLILCVVVVARLLHEERYLSEHLGGYKEYCHTVRRRLVPYIW